MVQTIRLLAFGLAEAFLRGRWDVDEMSQRAKSVIKPPSHGRWVKTLARRVVTALPGPLPPSFRQLTQFLERDDLLCRRFNDLWYDGDVDVDFDLCQLPRPAMQPASGPASTWAVRSLVTTGEVADWLGLTHHELDWFANRYSRDVLLPKEKLLHYRYRWVLKSSGGRRLLEIPKSRLKRIQRLILDEILTAIPPHPAAHAFRRGRSIGSAIAPHAGKRIVIRMDLREFFPSVRRAQVYAIFRTAGYPESVAAILTSLCTHRTPRQVLSQCEHEVANDLSAKRYRSLHLPQGSPTSPALANLAAFWLDCRLHGLAQKLGAHYTRYADDLIVSGGSELVGCISRFRVLVAAIVHHEGFEIRSRKTRIMLSGSRQQIAGITFNQRVNMPRAEYDNLRAILHNCCQLGPASQNKESHPHFREHLLGRIAYWSNLCPERAAKLRAMFDKIVWD
jgi:RNA-directed DNA polymerase